jgi:hypothetical protein
MPRKRQHQTDAERIQAHREREARRGRVRLEITVDEGIADWLRTEAREQRRTISEVVKRLVSAEHLLRRSTAEFGPGGWTVMSTPGDADEPETENASRPDDGDRGTSHKPT